LKDNERARKRDTMQSLTLDELARAIQLTAKHVADKVTT
jgi:hypothetical protein